MLRIIFFLFIFLVFQARAAEPLSGIRCKDMINKNYVEYVFKKYDQKQFAKVYKRINGEFEEVGNVVGKKLSSFILFEDKTILSNLDFAWHLDEVTKTLKPFVLSGIKKNDFKLPQELSCISRNFWY